MSGIIVAFPKKENASSIRNILTRGGIDVAYTATTGAKVLQYADLMDEGIIICGHRFPDMHYSMLRESLGDSFEMLLIASQDKWEGGLEDGVIGLPMPIKVYDLLNTVEMMTQSMLRRKRKRKEEMKHRNAEKRAVIDQAKGLLMERNHMTEEEAHRYLQKNSMESGTNILETAQMVITIMKE